MIYRRQPALDGLRGLAALIVFFAHVSDATGSFWWFGQGAGYIGVMLFFCLSGYLLTYIYFDTRLTWESLRHYITRRIGRVVPLYYVMVTLALILQINGATLFISPIGSALDHYIFLRGVGVFWTIPIEMHFYAIFVALWAIGARARFALYASLIIGIALFCLFPLDPLKFWNTIPFYLAYFIGGMLIARLPNPRVPHWAWSVAFVGFGSALFLMMPPVAALIGSTPPIPPLQVWQTPLHLFVIGGLLLSSVRSGMALILLGNRISASIGAISFSIYLVHVPVVTLFAQHPALKDNPMLFMALALAVTMGLSALSYHYIELPGQALVARLASRLDARDNGKKSSGVKLR